MPSDPTLLPGVSIVVPVYNSEKTLEPLVTEVLGVLEATGRDFEVLLVNDCSADGSWKLIERLAAAQDRVRGIDLRRNYGQHNTLLCGIRNARYGVVVTMDDDLQHPPQEVPKLLDKLEEGDDDVVYGVPEALPHSFVRNLLSGLTKWALASATGSRQVSEQSPFRAFRTDLRAAFANFRSPDILLDVLLTWGTSRFATVPVAYEPRREGTSNYSVRRLVNMGILLLTAYSTAPLRFASWIGFSLTLFGIAILLNVLYVYFFYGSIPGFPFLASIISIFSGAQLFALGIFGEYLARIFNRSMDRPAYVIRKTTDGADVREEVQRHSAP